MTPETFLARNIPAILIEIAATKGSAPRETDAFMLVSATEIYGTVGGGHMEFIAIDNARALLAQTGGTDRLDIPLGPEIGQCCGGRVELVFSRAEGENLARFCRKLKQERETQPSVWLFGGGNVGKALADCLSLLPLNVHAVETRQSELDHLPPSVKQHLTPMPEALVSAIRPGSAVLVVTHDHALDFLIAKEALARSDLAYVGMIGSKTKRATFASWLTREGGETGDLARLTLPIGGIAVRDKRPEIIAALTAAELLAAFAAYDRR
ncbi:xanthine dehydrogenase accessory protein XdhC [Pararhizobium sp.]|uniref:xanthine dehydrogenase accessory protein XdhC n=1 Tax=Pararhizobium sp. TaxID=1977563 RepID=UPI002721BAAF|nr:xanthine dehydrogenase accessory protein XdhC [Pararhizobium sp.]MDO9414897.1 xanthine dehydrogenase accessory protein XdhC [Pararhizobium sp.]